MQPQTELLMNIRDEIERELKDIRIALSELSDDGRIYMELGDGRVEKEYFRGPSVGVYPVLFLIKRPAEKEPDCVEALSGICNYYKKKWKSPSGGSYQARGAVIASEPNKAGRQEDGNVLYSCIINFKISY